MDFFERLAQLPPQAQEFFQSDEIRLAIERAALAYKIPKEKIPNISDVIGRIFILQTPLASIDSEIARAAAIEPKVSNGLCLLLLDKIFRPFPSIYTDVDGIIARLSSNAERPQLLEAEVESALLKDEPWLAKKTPETVLSRKVKVSIQPMKEPVTSSTMRLSLLKALSKFPHLSDQIVTNEKIKLKTSAELVRPTLGNWIKYYRDELGIGFHEEIERGRFLFQSQNGKRLSNEERAKLNLILKSIEEEFPVEIDVTRQVLVFPSGNDATMQLVQVGQAGKGGVSPRPMSSGKSPSFVGGGKPVFRVEQKGMSPGLQVFRPFASGSREPAKNISGETLHFSTGHVMPAEQASPDLAQAANEALRQMQHPTQSIDRTAKPPASKSPYSIRPLRLRSDGDQSA